MSHYVVWVVTREDESLDEVLAPFDENLEVEPYPNMTHSAPEKLLADFQRYAEYLRKGKMPDELSETEEEKSARNRLSASPETDEQKLRRKERDNYCPDYMEKYLDAGCLQLFEAFFEKVAGSDWMTALGLNYDGRTFREALNEDFLESWGDSPIEEDGYVHSTYNPDSKWDWFAVGGRWPGMLLLKNGGSGARGKKAWGIEESDTEIYERDGRRRADSARLGDIDWDQMHKNAIAQAEKDWDASWKLFEEKEARLTENGTVSWQEIMDRELNGDPQMRNRFEHACQYHEKEPTPEFFRLWSLNDYWNAAVDLLDPESASKSEYVKRNGVVSPFAVLYNGEWIEKGKMGWFGQVHDEKSCKDWHTLLETMMAEVGDSATLTVVDCHI